MHYAYFKQKFHFMLLKMLAWNLCAFATVIIERLNNRFFDKTFVLLFAIMHIVFKIKIL